MSIGLKPLVSYQRPTFSSSVGFPATALGLRRLVSDYTGPLIRVRRSSDNTEQDIGFTVGGLLNTTALLSFVGSGDGFVVTVYDQSFGGTNMTANSVAEQGRVVIAGSLVRYGQRPAIAFSNSAYSFDSFHGPSVANLSIFYVGTTNWCRGRGVNNSISPGSVTVYNSGMSGPTTTYTAQTDPLNISYLLYRAGIGLQVVTNGIRSPVVSIPPVSGTLNNAANIYRVGLDTAGVGYTQGHFTEFILSLAPLSSFIDVALILHRDYLGIETETESWWRNVANAGGSCVNSLYHIDSFVKLCKSFNVWANLVANNVLIMPFCTDTFEGLFVPLIAPAGAVPTNQGFVSADYSYATGLNPGNPNPGKYIDSGWVPNTYGAGTISAYMRNVSIVSSRVGTVGADSLGGFERIFLLQIRYDGANMCSYIAYNGQPSQGRVDAFSTATSGLFTGTRRAFSDASYYHNGSPIGSTTNGGGGFPFQSMHIYQSNPGSGGSSFYSRETRVINYTLISGASLTDSSERFHSRAVLNMQYGLSTVSAAPI